MSTISINELDPHLLYEGYLWMSNAPTPNEYHYDRPLDTEAFKLPAPFVAQGYLYNKDEGISISIKFVDGRYLVHRFKVAPTDFEDETVELLHFETLRMQSKQAAFLRYWKEQTDPLCLGLPVLVFDRLVFVGFVR